MSPPAILEGSRTSHFQKNFGVDIWQYLSSFFWVHYALVLWEGTSAEVSGFSQTVQHNLFAQNYISSWESVWALDLWLRFGIFLMIFFFLIPQCKYNYLSFSFAARLRCPVCILNPFSPMRRQVLGSTICPWEGKSKALVAWKCSIQEFSSMTHSRIRTNSVAG